MKDTRTVMPRKEELDAETFIEKEGLILLDSKQEDAHFEQIDKAKSDGIREMLISHTWTEISIERTDEDGNYKSGSQITNGIWRVNRLGTYVSKKPWSKSIRIGNTTLSVKEGDIWANSWYEEDLEECA